MKKSNVAIVLLVFFAFLFFLLGAILLVSGSLLENDSIIEIGLVSLLTGVGLYAVLFIFLIVHFIRKGKKGNEK